MTIVELKTLAENRMVYLETLRLEAQRVGDVRRIVELDQEISDTQTTLNKLSSL